MDIVAQLPQFEINLMQSYNLIVGIDISKDSFDAQWSVVSDYTPTHKTFKNTAAGIFELFECLRNIESDSSRILVCCEFTGVYMDKLSVAVQSLACTFWPVHPTIIKNYNIEMVRTKSDKVDSGRIFEFAFNHRHKAVHFTHKDWVTSQLKDLFRLRKQLTRTRTQFMNFRHALKHQAFSNISVSSYYIQMIGLINTYIANCDKEIMCFIKRSPELHKAYKILVSIPGIGNVIAVHLIAISECFEKIADYKALACFIGIAPFEYSSGSSIKRRPRVSKKAYKPLKADIHQGSISIIRKGQLFHDYYNKMKNLNKPHNWIINSISNMLAKIAFDLIKKNELFDKAIYLANKTKLKNNLQMS